MVRIGKFDLGRKAAIVAVIEDNPVETAKTAKELGADILEIRIDLLGIKDLQDARQVIEKVRSTTNLPCIVTNRSQTEGGRWAGSEEDRIALLVGVLSFADAVDIELSTDDMMLNLLIARARTSEKTVIISSHDFAATPTVAEMKKILDKSFKLGADIAKLAVMPNSRQDVLDLLQVTLDAKAPVCTISMGELGKHSRIVALFYGSVLTYGSVKNAVATGQLKVDELKAAMGMLL
ncbi:MAG: type I 3-dehydroquinate dehydratase [Methanosarcinaceae archaeon]|nr:type I 3-dehydroquinate dehydratase [Methanosarcinaceae archaeon]